MGLAKPDTPAKVEDDSHQVGVFWPYSAPFRLLPHTKVRNSCYFLSIRDAQSPVHSLCSAFILTQPCEVSTGNTITFISSEEETAAREVKKCPRPHSQREAELGVKPCWLLGPRPLPPVTQALMASFWG